MFEIKPADRNGIHKFFNTNNCLHRRRSLIRVSCKEELILMTHETKLISALVWNFTQRRLVVCYRYFGTYCRCH